MSEDKTLTERAREAAQAPRRLPMTYTDSYGHTVGAPVPIVAATEADIKRFSESGHVCGECHHFCGLGDEAFAGQVAQMNLLVRLVDEYEWKLHHAMPGGLPTAGLCEAHGYVTQSFAAAKDCAFTPRRGKLRQAARETSLAQIAKDRAEANAKQRERNRKFRERYGL